MKDWQEDFLEITSEGLSKEEVFKKIADVATSLGFQYCAYGLRMPVPLSNPKTFIMNNYSAEWQERYQDKGYLHIDPTVLHGRQSQMPIIWSEKVFSNTRELWDDSQIMGLTVGWAQSSLDAVGVGGMLTLARSHEALSSVEISSQEIKMRWLVSISHLTLSKLFAPTQTTKPLTAREIEVFKWTADGKTSGEISDILNISENTVNFHVKNGIGKLQTANKTAAVVRAAMLGMLN